jgi:hypothetical protein
MQSASAIRSVVPAAGSHRLPKTFEQALSAGWVIVNEGTTLSLNQKTRRGKVILGIEGRSSRLSVSYTATKARFEFGAPRLIE